MQEEQHHEDNSPESVIERLNFALNAAGIGTWDLNPLRNEVAWDERCRELFGFALNEKVTYEEVLKYIHPEDAAIVNEAVQKALDPNNDGLYEARYRTTGCNDGNVRWILSKGKAYFNDQRIAYRFAGTAQDITEAVINRNKVETSDKIAQLALTNTNSGYFFLTLKTGEVQYSPLLAKVITGEEGIHLHHDHFLQHIHPDDLTVRARAYVIAGQTGKLDYECRVVHNDGSIHWMRTKGTYLNDDTGIPYALVGTAHDITDEHIQKGIENRFKHIINSAPTGLWLSDEAGGMTNINRPFIKWTGIAHKDLLGIGWQNAIYEEDRAAAIDTYTTAIAARSHYDSLFRLKKPDGSTMWCRAAGDPFYREDGSFAGYACFCMDIEELVAGSAALSMSEERFRSIVEQAPLGIGLLTGSDMVIELGNEKIFELWRKNDEITGMKLLDALPELKDQVFPDLLKEVYRTGKPFYGTGAGVKLLKNGIEEEAFFDFAYTPIRNAADTVTSIMVLATEVTEQTLARKKIEESEARFRSLIEEAPVATAIYTGRDFRIQTANAAMIQLWGKDESVVGKTLHIALPELEGQQFFDLLNQVFDTGVAYHQQDAVADLVVDNKLQRFYFNFTYKPLHNEHGEVYAILNMAVDVTEQISARRQLEESELFSRTVIYNSPVAKVVFTGEDMVISTINENMLTMLGKDSNIIGKPFSEAIPELAATPLTDRLLNVYHTGETYIHQEGKLNIIKNGIPHTGYYNYIYKALYNTAGAIYGIIVTATDVTDQVLARRKIEQAEETLRGAIELAELGTWNIDFSSGYLYCSDRTASWFDLEPGKPIEVTRVLTAIADADRKKAIAAFHQALQAASGGAYDVECTLKAHHTGKTRILHAQGKVSFDGEGNPTSITGTAQDVTRQRQIQLALEQLVQERTEELAATNEELQSANEELAVTNEELGATNEELTNANNRLLKSNEELAQYAYVASHDLQEPLRKIRVFSGLLSEQQSLPPENKPIITKIAQSAERMALLIGDLLSFSKLLNSENLYAGVVLEEVIANVINDFELIITEKEATIEVSSLPVIQAISLQMNQLFYNLINNALKFQQPGAAPVIKITAEKISHDEAAAYLPRLLPFAQYHHITVADNGIGFDTQYAGQIFEVFKRLHSRHTYPGSGIGLALCRRIVGNHQGVLFATSEIGIGSVFHIILPDRQYGEG